jgi:tRNA (mo5U34)-methyltransferase
MQEEGWPKLAFLEHGFANDPTNWWCPNHAGAQAMLRAAGMEVIARPGHEIYICAPNPDRPSSVTTWNAAEILAATGRPWKNASNHAAAAQDDAAKHPDELVVP